MYEFQIDPIMLVTVLTPPNIPERPQDQFLTLAESSRAFARHCKTNIDETLHCFCERWGVSLFRPPRIHPRKRFAIQKYLVSLGFHSTIEVRFAPLFR